MKWYEYNNEIPLNTLKAWREEILATAQFGHTGWTGAPREPYRHWCYTPAYGGVYKKVFECLNESFIADGFNLKPDRLLLNLYNHGDSSWLHTDNDDSNAWTAILFMNEYWDLNWGGDFALIEDNEIHKAFAPTPGKFLLFQSNVLHGARPVSREAEFPRMGLTFQCINNSKV